ncbi:hypothetical protein DCE93_03295 [Agromyces badenianii]|uniref:Large exoprotein n=1 Tax=Agromyces badenianii TaxID=2080742 RepID=A0A2S0WU10_9MICO|nr:hypothetical protein [Agromyces badenianii]AWB94802.1 hypothetical protein DCE93_03295 [Agromyces badenianii]
MDVIGGGLLVAVAAALWIAYLLPNWLRRRQYLATERNAVRLQQTLRILAETAETPEPVRVEATAREVAAQQRILQQREATARLAAEAAEQEAYAERRAAEHAADAARQRVAAVRATVTEPIAVVHGAAVGATRPAARTGTAASATSRRTLRRKRALCSLVLLVSLIAVIAGGIAAAFGAPLIVPVAGALGVVVAIAGVARLARVRPVVASAALPAAPVEERPLEPIELAEADSPADGWMPRPLPRPLHLSRGTIAATAMASIEAAAELKRAEIGDDIARRAAELEPEVPAITPAVATVASGYRARQPAAERGTAAASPYSSMGIIDDAQPGFEDLDAVLRRRRQAG